MSKKIKILGIGSPFGDDRVGWMVADALQRAPEFQAYLDKTLIIKSLNRPHLSLLQEFDQTERVYLVDAMISGRELGAIKQFSLVDIDVDHELISTHGFGVIQSLQMAKVLKALPEQLSLYGIEIKEIGREEALSPAVAIAASRLVGMLSLEIINQMSLARSGMPPPASRKYKT